MSKKKNDSFIKIYELYKMEDISILFFLMFITLSILVISNTYNIYRISNIDYEKRSLMDLTEFDNVHPMLKELYHEIVIKGYIPFYTKVINDLITTNDIDKWYNANKKDIKNIISFIQLISAEYLKSNEFKEFIKMDLNLKALLQSFNLKELSENLSIVSESIKSGKITTNKDIDLESDIEKLEKITSLLATFVDEKIMI